LDGARRHAKRSAPQAPRPPRSLSRRSSSPQARSASTSPFALSREAAALVAKLGGSSRAAAFLWALPASLTFSTWLKQLLDYSFLTLGPRAWVRGLQICFLWSLRAPNTWQTAFWTVPLISARRQPSSHFCKAAESSSTPPNSITCARTTTFFSSQTRSDFAVPSCKQAHQTLLRSHPLLFISTPIPIQCFSFPWSTRSSHLPFPSPDPRWWGTGTAEGVEDPHVKYVNAPP